MMIPEPVPSCRCRRPNWSRACALKVMLTTPGLTRSYTWLMASPSVTEARPATGAVTSGLDGALCGGGCTAGWLVACWLGDWTGLGTFTAKHPSRANTVNARPARRVGAVLVDDVIPAHSLGVANE